MDKRLSHLANGSEEIYLRDSSLQRHLMELRKDGSFSLCSLSTIKIHIPALQRLLQI